MDKNTDQLGCWKEYEIDMTCALLGIDMSKLIANYTADEDHDIEFLRQEMREYYLAPHYEDAELRYICYKSFKNENLPNTISLIKKAIEKGNVNRGKWMPLLKEFFAKANDYLEEGPGDWEEKDKDKK